MTREHKLALIVGFSLVLVVGVLISDHFSKAHTVQLGEVDDSEPVNQPVALVNNADIPMPIPGQRPATPMEPPPAMLADALPQAPIVDHEVAVISMAGGAVPPADEPVAQTQIAFSGPTAIAEILDSDQATGGSMTLRPLTPAPVTRIDPVRRQSEAPVVKTPEPKPTPALPVSKGTLQRHEVAKGDTLYKLADRYYGDRKLWKQLQGYNKSRVDSDGGMRAGVTLLIPPKDVLLGTASLPTDAAPKSSAAPATAPSSTTAAPTKSAPSNDKPKATPPAAKPKAPATYIVRAGDTLSKIAGRELGNQNRWEEILDLNHERLGGNDTLLVGMQLKLPSRR